MAQVGAYWSMHIHLGSISKNICKTTKEKFETFDPQPIYMRYMDHFSTSSTGQVFQKGGENWFRHSVFHNNFLSRMHYFIHYNNHVWGGMVSNHKCYHDFSSQDEQ